MNIVLKKLSRVMCFIMILFISSILMQTSNEQKVAADFSIKNVYGDINNEQNVNEFIDGYFNKKMKKYNVPGAAVIIVKDNKEILKKAYGYSDLKNNKKVDADKTKFALASGSKLFTATAILQLYEQGKLNLDKNIEEYISSYKIKNPFDRPVTCRNLLTHTSGLDEASEFNSKTENVNNIKPQKYYMDTHIPVVIKEPDTLSRYSNEGYNILGYIVERVSGMSYEDYVTENILKPLNMNNTSVRVYDKNTSKGYMYEQNSYSEFPLLYQYTSGSSGIITTAEDMKNFIIANLNNGSLDGKSILKPETIDMMHKKQFSNSENMPGMALGFERSNRNGQEIIKHEGALPGYTSTIFLMPKENLGICILTNSLSALPFNFENEFLDYFYHDDVSLISKNIDSNKDLSRYEGSYRSYDGVSVTTLMKIFGIFEDMKITDNKDGTLTLEEYTTEKEKITTTLIPKGNNEFLRTDGKGEFAFRVDNSGNVTYAFNDTSFNAFEKVKFYETYEFNILLISITFLIFIINLLAVIVRKIINRKNRIKSKRSEKVIMAVNIIGQFMMIFGFIGTCVLIQLMSLNNDMCYRFFIYLFLTMIIIGTVFSIFHILIVFKFIINGKKSYKKILYLFINCSINLSFVWLLYYFNLLGYKIS